MRDYALLFLMGLLLALAHHFIKIPIQLPGKKGILWIAFIVAGRFLSPVRNAGTAMGMGSAAFSASMGGLAAGGTVDVMIYLGIGVALDCLYAAWRRMRWLAFAVPAVIGLLHVAKPLVKFPLSIIFTIPENSLSTGLMRPVLTHFLFGFLGACLGLLAASAFRRRDE